ncbi:hypothetical protein ACFPT7_05235 [Acidicapsa dinghuensis]|uniref:Helix-turn-helix domain-containing protein n=1 Tax=Acidicapsa dinghuensis TaxID=2218256 RepID=A0ABW1EBH3_9BACT|nr:hypothetical protein [Acidicapsa dinghuensis]
MESTQQQMNVPITPERSQNGFAPTALERHYSVSELSKLWFFSENTIRRLFSREPGVIKITRQATRVKRGYTSLRIPERIAQRVHQRLQGLS